MASTVPILEIKVVRFFTVLVLLFCIWITVKNHYEIDNPSSSNTVDITLRFPSWDREILAQFSSLSNDLEAMVTQKPEEIPANGMEYDFYRNSCPQAEQLIHNTVRDMYREKTSVAPALLRLVFHDCFVEGCDASILLDPAEGVTSEKDSPPNADIRGFPIIEEIKTRVEKACPGKVSCADIVVLAAREGVILSGGPFYPVLTGRRDSNQGFRDTATKELPSPEADLNQTLTAFALKGFNERETVAILGAHSVGVVHCKFFEDRLYNFSGTNKADPSLDAEFLDEMRSKCKNMGGESREEGDRSVEMAKEGEGVDFGGAYYKSLTKRRGIMVSDQQLMAGESSSKWVRLYASASSRFGRDFAFSMIKLSSIKVLTASQGQIRHNCSKIVYP